MLNRNDIINATHGGLDIFRHYLGRELRVGRKFRNPFYQDIHTLHAACISTAGAEYTSIGISGMKIMQAIVSIWWRRYTICRVGKQMIL